MTKKQMKALCKQHKITIPSNAKRKQLCALLYSFYSDAVIVKNGSGYELLRTDKEFAEFTVDFYVYGNYFVRAENEKAAISWVREHLYYNFDPVQNKYICIDIGGVEIGDVKVCNSETENDNEII